MYASGAEGGKNEKIGIGLFGDIHSLGLGRPRRGAISAEGCAGPSFSDECAQDATYLQQGILDMLVSRLEWKDKVDVVPVEMPVRPSWRKAAGWMSQRPVRLHPKWAPITWCLGSFTLLGQKVSLDASILDLAAGSKPVRLSTQTDSLDGVIRR